LNHLGRNFYYKPLNEISKTADAGNIEAPESSATARSFKNFGLSHSKSVHFSKQKTKQGYLMSSKTTLILQTRVQ